MSHDGGSGRGRRVLLALTLPMALGLVGCSLVFKRPTVRVGEVRLESMNLGGGTLAVILNIENPNRFALESQDFRYALSFLNERGAASDPASESWIRLAEGQMAEPVKIPAHQNGSVTLHVPFDLATVGLAAGRLLRQGALEYRFSGELRFHTPVGGKRLPFDERGTFRP
jgi:LEA14-like dessication related protein